MDAQQPNISDDWLCLREQVEEDLKTFTGGGIFTAGVDPHSPVSASLRVGVHEYHFENSSIRRSDVSIDEVAVAHVLNQDEGLSRKRKWDGLNPSDRMKMARVAEDLIRAWNQERDLLLD